MAATTRALTIVILLVGCGSKQDTTNSTSATIAAEPKGSVAPSSEPATLDSQQPTGSAAPPNACAFKTGTPGMLCAKMENGVLRFEVTPKGCYSSSCTTFHRASCSVANAERNQIALNTDFCIEETHNSACTADCGKRDGSWIAKCDGGQAASGNYRVTAGDLTLTFTAPLKDAVCVGSVL